jgi:glycosyltransferase involved in cell wall biosynthesis
MVGGPFRGACPCRFDCGGLTEALAVRPPDGVPPLEMLLLWSAAGPAAGWRWDRLESIACPQGGKRRGDLGAINGEFRMRMESQGRASGMESGNERGRERGRVLFVIPRWESFRCFFRELVPALNGAGWEVHCAAGGLGVACDAGAGDAAGWKIPGVRWHRLEIPRGLDVVGQFRAANRLRRIVAGLEPDWVHAHFSAAILCVALAKRTGWPRVFGTFHGLGYPLRGGWMGRLLRVAECGSAARMDRVLVLTEDDRRMLARDLGGRRVEVLESAGVGCDLLRYDRGVVDCSEVERLRACWGLGGACVFGFVGRWTAFKGFACVARAFLEVARECEEARLLVVGGEDALHPDGLEDGERRRFWAHPGVIRAGQREDTAPLFALMDGLVFPSWREGVPVSVMEALAMGVPVLARRVRGCRDVVRDGVDGELLEPGGSWDRLAGRMRVWCREPGLRRRYAAGALEGRSRLSRARYVSEQVGFYGEGSACIGE